MELCNASLEQVFLDDGDARKYTLHLSKEDILLQLANGMKYIHDHGLVYQKAKPRNVLIYCNNDDPAGSSVSMKWADFGLSDGFLNIFESDGTAWLAPEIAKIITLEDRNQADQSHQSTNNKSFEADVYSEGLVFVYVLLDGEYPKQTYEARHNSSCPLEGNRAKGKNVYATIYYINI